MGGRSKIIDTRILPELIEFLADGLLEKAHPDVLKLLAKSRRTDIDCPTVYIEDNISARASGSIQTRKAIEDWSQEEGVEVDIVLTGSFGFLSGQPIVGIQLPGRNRLFFGPVQDFQVHSLFNAVMKHFIPDEFLLGQWGAAEHIEWEGISYLKDHPFFKGQERRVLHLNGIVDPDNVLEYIAWGGYHAFAKCIKYYAHDEIIRLIESSLLRGRSGSGFPAHLKWQKALSVPTHKRYVICNADESDPGAFMHRVLMEGNPHLIMEGLMLSAYAIGANEAIIYTRTRYSRVVQRLERALSQVRELGLIGQDIFESGFSLDIKIRKGPGAYVCGEETALIASIEGKRGMPKSKPPYPAEVGLYGQPTLVHNVETLAQVPLIVEKGPDWYKSIGSELSSGTKLFSLAGKFQYQGVVEVPFGYTLEKLCFENAQGVRDSKKPKAILAGGPSGKFIVPEQFSIPLDFEDYEANGLVLGSGSLILLDETSCPVDLVGHLMKFIQKESCGKCIPCREGTRRMADILDMVTRRPKKEKSHEALHRFKGVTQLSQMARVISETSLCGLGKGASNPLLSAMEHFREEFEEHVFDRVCRAGVCQELRSFYIDPESCTGCYICFEKCPEQAIVGSPRQVHVIVTDRCTGCGKCQEVCKFNAVFVH